MTLIEEIEEPNRTIIINSSKKLGCKPIELINYFITKDIEAIMMALYSKDKKMVGKIKDLNTKLAQEPKKMSREDIKKIIA